MKQIPLPESLPKSSKSTRRIFILERFRKARFLAVGVGLSLLFQLGLPNISYALTGGPTSPDFANFEPVATTNMVNEFTGQFVYNIPVLEIPGAAGGGYAMSLSYHSGDGPEAEASWVGSGWSLNPGCINRIKRGIPDDYSNRTIKYYNDVPKNWTVAATALGSLQAFSAFASLSSATTVRYNNYKGFGFSKNLGLYVMGGGFSLGYNYTAGDGRFSSAINPAAILSYAAGIGMSASGLSGSTAGRMTSQVVQSATSGYAAVMGQATSHYASYLLADVTGPYNVTPYEGKSVSGSVAFTANPSFVQIGMSAGVNINYTSQRNVAERDMAACGYMYSSNALDTGLMDYTIEHESGYNPRDMFLPVPTSTPDAFFVSGEGLGGGFRMYNERIGIFSPNQVTSHTDYDLFGVDAHAGQTNGAGGETFTVGRQDLTVKSDWYSSNGNTDEFLHTPYGSGNAATAEATFFRFNNDLGGKVLYDGHDNEVYTQASDQGITLSSDIKYLQKDAKVPAGRRSGRASYIGYHTNGEIKLKSGNKRYVAYEQNARIHYLAGRDDVTNDINDLIGEVSVNNAEGNNYVYGLPVYAAGDKNMMQGMNPAQGNKYLSNTSSFKKSKVGEQYGNTPYVTSYLLTQITTPDYVDVNLNGPDDADFGGYTRFMYKPVHWNVFKTGTNGTHNMYKWRTPYRGVYCNPMKLSDNDDDMGVYQSGYKEVYIVDTIETKTHFAVFETEDRLDGWSARLDDNDAAAGLGKDAANDKKLKKLKAIRLYAKSKDTTVAAKLIKTVHFQYDYTAWPGVYNNYDGVTPNNGKLTLKRVWFEYNGVVNATISPYEFEYTYPNVTYPSQYQFIKNEMNVAGVNQIPSYTPYIDAWGNYQPDGQSRRNKLQCWRTQKNDPTFDPAAWQLKRITLPSGGEIHVQYEQNSYAYVQNRMACAMVSLQGTPTDLAQGNVFCLNTGDLDHISSLDLQRLADSIKSQYRSGGRYMYYKFLYSIQGTASDTIGSCNSEYIDGFANVDDAYVDKGKLYVRFSENIPFKKCVDYFQKEMGGKIECSPSGNIPKDPGVGGNVADELRAIGESFLNGVKAELAGSKVLCRSLNPELSYLRIPIWNKQGAGVRVKRLLMYDKGVEADKGLYGTEYIYEKPNGESYGVATNEPIENMAENPLVDFWQKRIPDPKVKRSYQGHDDDQLRGPLSMNALPAASVGYSRIIKKNIHEDVYTGTGYTVVDYYTAKDYAFDTYYPYIGKRGASYMPITGEVPMPSPSYGLFSYDLSAAYSVSQSYCFIQNQMHGQIKSVTDYPGTYNPAEFLDDRTRPIPVAQTSFEYFEPGEQIPMYDFMYNATYYDQPGKEMDITVERRGVLDESRLTRITGDITVGMVSPVIQIPYTIAFPVTSTSRMVYNSLVVNKVIHYPAILKRTTVMKDGIYKRNDNVGFDPLTGNAVVTRTYDGYDSLKLYANPAKSHIGTYTQYNVPAASQYPDMGQKAWNERYVYSAPFTLGSGTSVTLAGINVNDIFHVGDMVALYGSGVNIAYVSAVSGTSLTFEPATRYNTTLPGGSYNKIEIIRSGYTNQLTASAGGWVDYGIDPDTRKGPFQFVTEMNEALRRSIKASLYPDTQVVNLSNYKGNLIYSDCAYVCNHTISKVGYMKIVKTSSTQYDLYAYDVNDVRLIHIAAGNCASNTPYTGGTFVYNMPSVVNTLSSNFSHPEGFYFNAFNPPLPTANGYYYLKLRNNSGTDIFFPVSWCIDFGDRTEGVLKASLTTYNDTWNYSSLYSTLVTLSTYEAGRKGKWRPEKTHVYVDETVQGSNPALNQRNYNFAGISNNFMKGPMWKYQPAYFPDRWHLVNTVMSYSPNGFATEERNAHGTSSTAKFGYYGMFPYLVTKGAPYNSAFFESFENVYPVTGGFTVEDALPVANTFYSEGHTGKQSFHLQANPGKSNTSKLLTFDNVRDHDGNGHVIRFWARTGITSNNDSAMIHDNLKVYKNGSFAGQVKFLGRSGKGRWILWEVKASGSAPGTNQKYEIFNNHNDATIYIDDVKIQPLLSKSTAYVYDVRTYKLSAVFDDDHFATIYQYNGEGKLIRKMRETIHGTKTTEETHSHTPTRLTLMDLENTY